MTDATSASERSLNFKQAADRAEVSIPRLRQIIRAGHGPRGRQLSDRGHWRFAPEDIDAWLRSRVREPAGLQN
jgi:hypothetical protein